MARKLSSLTTKNIALYAIFALAIGIFHLKTEAQTLYRIVGPDGKITFSDTPPRPADKTQVTVRTSNSFTPAANESLPTELRTAMQRFPVTLYAATACSACDSARSLLRSRGVPVKELSVANEADIAELRRVAGDSTLPVVSVGQQMLRGYSEQELTNYLDLAGYPKQSALPRNYQAPAAVPLTARTAEIAAPVTAPAAAPVAQPTPSAQPTNPAGIRF